MNEMTVSRIPEQRRIGSLVVTALLGLIGGASVSLFAFYLARYGRSGGNWSFRGNGALAAYTLIPALLAAGWSALILRARGSHAWFAIGIAAGVVGLILAAADAALLPVFGATADVTAGGPLLITLVAWTLASPVAAALIRLRAPRRSLRAIDAASLGVWALGVSAGVFLAGFTFPPGS